MRDRNRVSLLSLRLRLYMAWTDVVAYASATAALLPLLPRRRPKGLRTAMPALGLAPAAAPAETPIPTAASEVPPQQPVQRVTLPR